MGWSESYWDDVKSDLAELAAGPQPAQEEEAASEAGRAAAPSGGLPDRPGDTDDPGIPTRVE